MGKYLSEITIAMCAALFFAGIAGAAEQNGIETYQSLLVTPAWLEANIDKVVLIDARAQSLYTGQQGHLPGAVNAEWTYFANMAGKTGDPHWADIPDGAAFAKKIGALGIDGKKDVVVYGDWGDWGNSGWVVWALRMAGVQNARLLDGGFTGWRAAGGKTAANAFTNKAVNFPNTSLDPSYIVTTEWLRENLTDASVKIVDVRSEKEYTGEIRPFGEARPGHIPGAVNFSWDKVFTSDYKILPEPELSQILADAGFTDKEGVIVLYDTTGVRSAFMTMIFRKDKTG
jgi:3-mercaptopyruvate sulfurtransferase SseA